MLFCKQIKNNQIYNKLSLLAIRPKKPQRQPKNGSVAAVFGRSGGAQTRGLMVPNHPRYQLRHTPIVFFCYGQICGQGRIFRPFSLPKRPEIQGASTASGIGRSAAVSRSYTLPKQTRYQLRYTPMVFSVSFNCVLTLRLTSSGAQSGTMCGRLYYNRSAPICQTDLSCRPIGGTGVRTGGGGGVGRAGSAQEPNISCRRSALPLRAAFLSPSDPPGIDRDAEPRRYASAAVTAVFS